MDAIEVSKEGSDPLSSNTFLEGSMHAGTFQIVEDFFEKQSTKNFGGIQFLGLMLPFETSE